MSRATQLQRVVADYESIGCMRCDRTLGFTRMPDGYALMLDPDRMHFFWLRYDDAESVTDWDKWAIYRGAVDDSRKAVGDE